MLKCQLPSALFYTSAREIPTPLYTSSLKKVPLSGGASPVQSIIGSSPPRGDNITFDGNKQSLISLWPNTCNGNNNNNNNNNLFHINNLGSVHPTSRDRARNSCGKTPHDYFYFQGKGFKTNRPRRKLRLRENACEQFTSVA